MYPSLDNLCLKGQYINKRQGKRNKEEKQTTNKSKHNYALQNRPIDIYSSNILRIPVLDLRLAWTAKGKERLPTAPTHLPFTPHGLPCTTLPSYCGSQPAYPAPHAAYPALHSLATIAPN
ncbi:hypothetical protein VTK56DRAFT_6812 [Thermocarpiscus australiensis]